MVVHEHSQQSCISDEIERQAYKEWKTLRENPQVAIETFYLDLKQLKMQARIRSF